MSPQQNQISSFVGQRVWLAVALLTLTAILSLANLASAQQDSTASTLAAPTLSAQAGENGVDLSWTAVQGATRYELWAWTSAGGWQEIGGDSLTATTSTHTSAEEGITYLYTVRAVNADNVTSAWSDYASATLPSSSVPSLTAQATGNGMELSWTAVTGAVRYELWEWDSVNNWQQIGGDNLTGTTYTRTGGTAGTTYYYTVRAVDAEGEKSGWSQYVRATVPQEEQQGPQHTATPSATPSSTPTATPTATHTLEPSSLRQPDDPKHTATPTATPTSTSTSTPTATSTATSTATATPPAVPLLAAAASQSSVSLSWSSVTGAARYQLWVWDSVNEWQQLGGDSLTDSTFTHYNVTAGTTYSYAVRSVGASGVASAWSRYATVTIPSQSDPPTATPTLEPQLSQQQQLEPTATPSPTATPTPTSTASPTATPTTQPQYSTVPDVPDPPTVIVLGAGRVSVDWDDVPRATYYDLWYWSYPYWRSVKEEGPRRGISFSFNGSSAVLTNMPTNFPSYSFRVLAENSVGLRISTSGSAENPEEYRLIPTPTPTVTPTITPTPEGWPSAPNKPTARLIGVGSVAIDWDPVPEEATYDVYLYHYVVFGFLRRWVRLPYNGVDVDVGGYVREDIRISMSGTSATITNLPYKSQYSFSVRARNDVGSSFSPSVTVDNPPTSTPTPTSTATSTPTSTPTSTATPTPTPTTDG